MRVTAIVFGTRGDVTPFVALGIRLRANGHDVCVATHADFEPLVRQHGLEFRALPGSFQKLVASREGRRALGVPRNSVLGLRGLFLPFRDCAEALYDESWEASANADAILCSALATRVASLIAERRNLPLALGLPIPSVRTGQLP